MPVDTVVTRERHFDPFDHQKGLAAGSHRATVPAGRGHFSGYHLLTDTGSGPTAGRQLRPASAH